MDIWKKKCIISLKPTIINSDVRILKDPGKRDASALLSLSEKIYFSLSVPVCHIGMLAHFRVIGFLVENYAQLLGVGLTLSLVLLAFDLSFVLKMGYI